VIKTDFVVAMVVFLSGCVHNRGFYSIPEINSLTRDRKVHLTLSDGRVLDVVEFQIRGDSCRWLSPTDEKKQIVHKSYVRSVAIAQRGRGASEGFLLGGLIGLVGGVAMGYASGDDNPEGGFISMTAKQKAVFLGFLLGGSGALIGLPIGAVVGSKDQYLIE